MQNKFVKAVSSLGTTENGALTYTTSSSGLVDYFFSGAVRNKDSSMELFAKAFKDDKTIAIKLAFYLRDARNGQGKRDVIKGVIEYLNAYEPNTLQKILPYIPLVGRWKDVFEYAYMYNQSTLEVLKTMIIAGMSDDFQKGLVGKWLPREKDSKGNAKVITKLLELSEREYRKISVALSNTVEQKMCAKEWNSIDFSKLPSRAAKIYQKAFERNAPEAYAEYVASLVEGEAKVNANTLYPHDLVVGIRRHQGNKDVMNAQWDALPDYMSGTEFKNILPVIDTSSSMNSSAYGNITAMDVSISIGIYLSTRNKGEFKNLWCNFDTKPQLKTITGNTLSEYINSLDYNNWGGNTNIQAVFDLILNRAVSCNVPEEDMPQAIVIVSDMEFDYAVSGRTNFEVIKRKYSNSGYKMPVLVFWNACSRNSNVPVSSNEDGVILIGGYSPVIMKNVLESGFKPVTPFSMMMSTIEGKYEYLNSLNL